MLYAWEITFEKEFENGRLYPSMQLQDMWINGNISSMILKS